MTTHRSTLAKGPLHRFATSVLLAGLILVGCDKQSPESAAEAESESTAKDPSKEASKDRPDAKAEESETEPSAGDARARKPDDPPRLLRGRITPGRVTELYPRWRDSVEEAEVSEEDAKALAAVEPGAEVTVYLGTWCPDSRREVSRLWKALRLAGGDVPFSVEYVGLDRDMNAGDVSLEGKEIQFVPTFVVERGGEEVGRIVESAPDKLERDLHALLSGNETGVLSNRDDL